MQADWLWGLLGGVMIGTAASAYLLINGKVMGISGIFGGLVDGTGWHDRGDRVAFVAGLVLVPLAMSFGMAARTHLTGNWALVIAGGLLVGFGTRLANGCTSGHGVCGISRLSVRGIVASAAYVLAGALVMAGLRHVLGWL